MSSKKCAVRDADDAVTVNCVSSIGLFHSASHAERLMHQEPNLTVWVDDHTKRLPTSARVPKIWAKVVVRSTLDAGAMPFLRMPQDHLENVAARLPPRS